MGGFYSFIEGKGYPMFVKEKGPLKQVTVDVLRKKLRLYNPGQKEYIQCLVDFMRLSLPKDAEGFVMPIGGVPMAAPFETFKKIGC